MEAHIITEDGKTYSRKRDVNTSLSQAQKQVLTRNEDKFNKVLTERGNKSDESDDSTRLSQSGETRYAKFHTDHLRELDIYEYGWTHKMSSYDLIKKTGEKEHTKNVWKIRKTVVDYLKE